MAESIRLDGDTRLTAIMETYPWLKDELIRMEPQFKRLDSPVAKVLLKKATLTDASHFSNVPVDELIRQLQEIVDRRSGEKDG